MKRLALIPYILFVFLFHSSIIAKESPTSPQGIYKQSVKLPIDDVYASLQLAMNDSPFFLSHELNIGSNLARFSERWGKDYNQNKLTGFRSMVFCNGWYANKISNLDPDLLGSCPLHISIIEKSGVTSVLFNRPSTFAKSSPALPALKELEAKVIRMINDALSPE